MLLNSRQFKFLKNYRNINVKSSATIIRSRALGALILASEARDENVRAKRADFFLENLGQHFLSRVSGSPNFLDFRSLKIF